MKKENVFMGTTPLSWMHDKNIKTITFSVTDDCNLMCKYCYFTHKTNKNKMSFEIAQKTIDYVLSDSSFLIYDGVIWDFIGGEPTLEMDLIDEICDYILYKMYVTKHKWLSCYRIMIGTNGLLYTTDKFQRFIYKHDKNIHVNITVDGSKEKHDLSRIKKDGSGSYDDVVKALPFWFKQIGATSTKSTFSHDDLPYLKDSIINLWNLGFKIVMANVVFENVWKENDDIIFEEQLKLLADYVIDNELWDKVSVRFFSSRLGYPLSDQETKVNFCGSGNMMAVDYKGYFYPCIRFMDSALNNKSGRIIGDIENGLDTDKIRAFNTLTYEAQSKPECIDCEVASGCAWCSGLNYDEASEDTVFERQTFHCKMHKANVRANVYFWKRFEEKTKRISPLRYNMYANSSTKNKYLYILNNNQFNHCHISPPKSSYLEMSNETYERAIALCDKLGYIPVHVGFEEPKKFGYYIGTPKSKYIRNDFTIDVVNHDEIKHVDTQNNLSKTIIYKVNYNELLFVIEDVQRIIALGYVDKINLVVVDYFKWDKSHLKMYQDILTQLVFVVVDNWKVGKYIQIDVITNNLFLDKKQYCLAGNKEFTVSPIGEIYPCAAYYYENKNIIGTLSDESGLKKFDYKKLLVCERCEANNCNKCSFLNKKLTCERNAPFEVHCVKANIENNAACLMLKTIERKQLELPFEINKKLREGEILDPLVELRTDSFMNKGFYKI